MKNSPHVKFLTLMKIGLLSVLVVLLALVPTPAFAQKAAPLFSVTIPMEVGRQVRVWFPDGTSRQIGEVLRLPTKLTWPAFDASKWGTPSTAVAVAANTMHILVDVLQGRGRIISLLPTYTKAPAARASGAVLIEGIGGQKIWGAWAPPVGTPVYAVDEAGVKNLLSPENVFTAKALQYTVYPRPDAPLAVEIENKYDGNVTVIWPGRTALAGTVIHPVNGIGFFDGSHYQDVGRIRANHPGVVCISTSPYGERGGFQIIPEKHSKSPEMKMSMYEPQWMIIRPLLPVMEPGREPLFSGFLVPGPNPLDGGDGIYDYYIKTPQVECRIDGGAWQPLPPVTKNGPDSPMKRITHLRIVFPYPLRPLPTPAPQASKDIAPLPQKPSVTPTPVAPKPVKSAVSADAQLDTSGPDYSQMYPDGAPMPFDEYTGSTPDSGATPPAITPGVPVITPAPQKPVPTPLPTPAPVQKPLPAPKPTPAPTQKPVPSPTPKPAPQKPASEEPVIEEWKEPDFSQMYPDGAPMPVE